MKGIKLQCMECDKTFYKNAPKAGFTKCPKCASTDLELAA